MQVKSGRLTHRGIAFTENHSTVVCQGCRKQKVLINYYDILSIEQHEKDHYYVKYLEQTKEAELATLLIKIPERGGVLMESQTSHSDSYEDIALTRLNSDEMTGKTVEEIVMSRAFFGASGSDRLPVLVIINPHSGPGEAKKWYDQYSAPIFAAAGVNTRVIVTKASGEATDIARQADMELHDSIVLVSGDGLPHEVLNGLATRPHDASQALRHFALAQLPGGSGNAMSLSLNAGEQSWRRLTLNIIKGRKEPHDIMAVSTGSKLIYSFLSQSYGIVADCDLGTEHLRWMGGSRFVVGLVYKALRSQTYPCEVAYKEGSAPFYSETDPQSLTPTLTVKDPVPPDWTVERHEDLSMFYVGKMDWMSSDARMFPKAEATDGSMDMILWDTSFGSVKSLNTFRLSESGGHLPNVPFYKKIEAYRLTPLVREQFLSIDGESFDLEPIHVTVLRGVARFISLQEYDQEELGEV